MDCDVDDNNTGTSSEASPTGFVPLPAMGFRRQPQFLQRICDDFEPPSVSHSSLQSLSSASDCLNPSTGGAPKAFDKLLAICGARILGGLRERSGLRSVRGTLR